MRIFAEKAHNVHFSSYLFFINKKKPPGLFVLLTFATAMRAISLKIVSWVWLLAFAFATTGVSLHRVHCFCTGQTNWSLFEGRHSEEDTCQEDAYCSSQSAEEPSCCLSPRALVPHPALALPPLPDSDANQWCAQDDHACKSYTVVSYKLKADYLPDALKTIKLECPAWMYDTPLLRSVVRPSLCALPPDPARPPPPLSGRERCILHELFLC